ncbi:hypothetical protein BKA70DRAFT_1310345 [Coprinopsis sp. MPI-PUGE-AT-0042]|nr:hypothetical protein BKA70DRAFT_1310345 [Coprinopsis sp. MPI-PUGE-AT-0042]
MEDKLETPPSRPFTYGSLETLIIDGEDSTPILAHIALPSLKFLGLKARGITGDVQKLQDQLAGLFHRFNLANLTISLKGTPDTTFLSLLLHNLPSNTRLHFGVDHMIYNPDLPEPNGIRVEGTNIKEVFCTNETGHLGWLDGDPSPFSNQGSVTVYIPLGTMEESDVSSWTKALREKGCELEVQREHILSAMVRSSIPSLHYGWQI